MSHGVMKRRAKKILARAPAAAVASWLALQLFVANAILDAAGVKPGSTEGWGKITAVANELKDPLLVTMVAAVPLGILGGGLLMAIGHRHAAKMLGQIVAGVVVVGIGTTLAH